MEDMPSKCNLNTLTETLQYARLKKWLDNCTFHRISEGDTIKFTNSIFNHVYKNCTFVVLSKFQEMNNYYTCRLISYNDETTGSTYEDIILNLSKYSFDKILKGEQKRDIQNIKTPEVEIEMKHEEIEPLLQRQLSNHRLIVPYDSDYSSDFEESSSNDEKKNLSDSSSSLESLEDKTESIFNLLDNANKDIPPKIASTNKNISMNICRHTFSKMNSITEIEEDIELQEFNNTITKKPTSLKDLIDISAQRNIEMYINKDEESLGYVTSDTEEIISDKSSLISELDFSEEDFLSSNTPVLSLPKNPNPFDLLEITNPFDLPEIIKPFDLSEIIKPFDLSEISNSATFKPLEELKPFDLSEFSREGLFQPVEPLKPFDIFGRNEFQKFFDLKDTGKIIPKVKSPVEKCKVDNFMVWGPTEDTKEHKINDSFDFFEKIKNNKQSHTSSTTKIDNIILEDIEDMSIESIDNNLDNIINNSIKDLKIETDYNKVLNELTFQNPKKLIEEINEEEFNETDEFNKILEDLKKKSKIVEMNINSLKYKTSLHELLKVVKTKEIIKEIQKEEEMFQVVPKKLIEEVEEKTEEVEETEEIEVTELECKELQQIIKEVVEKVIHVEEIEIELKEPIIEEKIESEITELSNSEIDQLIIEIPQVKMESENTHYNIDQEIEELQIKQHHNSSSDEEEFEIMDEDLELEFPKSDSDDDEFNFSKDEDILNTNNFKTVTSPKLEFSEDSDIDEMSDIDDLPINVNHVELQEKKSASRSIREDESKDLQNSYTVYEKNINIDADSDSEPEEENKPNNCTLQ